MSTWKELRSKHVTPENAARVAELSAQMRASLERGLADSAAGRTTYLGSFAQYADDEEEPWTTSPH